MVSTVKFSQFNNDGNIANNAITVGYGSGINQQYTNPWVFLPPGSTGTRPVPSASNYYQLRLNTTLQQYEFYDPVTSMWVQLTQDNSTVVSVEGTANQVYVNGTSGSMEYGNIVLTTPQNIDTAANVTFNSLVLSNTGSLTNTNFVSANSLDNSFMFGTPTSISTPSSIFTHFQIGNNSSIALLDLMSFQSGGAGAQTIFWKTRSTTIGTYTAVQGMDTIGSIYFMADDGSKFTTAATIVCNVQGSVSSGIIPSELYFQTGTTTGGYVTGMTLSNAQILTLANPLPIGSGGLGITTTPTNGQVPIGNGTDYTAATITAGSGISIANGSGSITISSSGSAGWVNQTTSSVTMTTNTGYLINDSSSLVTLTLPTTSAVGDFVEITGYSADGWSIAQASGQQIYASVVNTTLGASGSLSSAHQYDNVRLRCLVANTIWTVVSQQSAGLTYV
jgi:hypothetical protein